MDRFQVRRMLSEAELFEFVPSSNRLLEEFMAEYGGTDAFESQYFSNFCALGSAEFSYMRSVFGNAGGLRSVNPGDVQLAITTTDTLRTRPCRSMQRAKQGGVNISDLSLFAGDVTKLADLSETDELESDVFDCEEYKRRLYDFGGWGEQHLTETLQAGFPSYMTLFASLRFAVCKDMAAQEASEFFGSVLRRLGLRPSAAGAAG